MESRHGRGMITDVRPVVRNGILRVVARIEIEGGGVREAYLPDREVSAFLPRSMLVGEVREAPRELLGTVGPILRRLAQGRPVRVWAYDGETYFSFLSWRAVRFQSAGPRG